MPSVSTARPTLTARSMASSLDLAGWAAISLAMRSETSSLLLFFDSSLMRSATPSTFQGARSFSTREARSSAIGISMNVSGSRPRPLARRATP